MTTANRKPGRPITTGPVLTVRKIFCLSPDIAEMLRHLAATHNVSEAEFVRILIRNAMEGK